MEATSKKYLLINIQQALLDQLLQALTPLVFCFELPIVAPTQPLPDITSPYVLQIQEQYNVQVRTRTHIVDWIPGWRFLFSD